MKSLSDYIMFKSGALPAELCDLIIKEYENADIWNSARIGSENREDKSYRDNEVIVMSASQIIGDSLHRKSLDNQMTKHVSRGLEDYFGGGEHFIMPNMDCGYQLYRYNIGGKYDIHVDAGLSNESPRLISIIFCLNDDYEGGELEFFYGEKIYRMRKGDRIMFPSCFTFPHAIKPVTAGVRYSVVTWAW